MSCQAVKQELALYFYGELTQHDEERIEQHLSGCPECRAEFVRLEGMLAALDRPEAAAPPELLFDCRRELMETVGRQGELQAACPEVRSPWRLLPDGLAVLAMPFRKWRQPIGALALVGLGFLAARFTLTPQPVAPPDGSADVAVSSVHSVRPAGEGRVQIAYDETRRRTLSGDLADSRVRELLEIALQGQANPGLRAETMSVIGNHPLPPEIISLLLDAARSDANPGVRSTAVESLRNFVEEPQVADALGEVLRNDENAGVRMQAIELLGTNKPASMIGVLQNVVEREPDSYIRMRVAKALQEMNASVGTF